MPKLLTIHLSEELWDPVKEEFIPPIEGSILIEHSLYAIAKWEEKYCKSFFREETGPKTGEELIDYVRFMTIGEIQNPDVYNYITPDVLEEVLVYMNTEHTGSNIKKKTLKGNKGQFLSSELVYSWLVGLEIPFECQYWNFNRLMILIDMCNEHNKPPDKMSKKATAKDYKALNDARRKKYKTNG